MAIAEAKAELRRELRARRAARDAAERERLGAELAGHAAALGSGPIAAFVGIRGEPDTLPLIAALLTLACGSTSNVSVKPSSFGAISIGFSSGARICSCAGLPDSSYFAAAA